MHPKSASSKKIKKRLDAHPKKVVLQLQKIKLYKKGTLKNG